MPYQLHHEDDCGEKTVAAQLLQALDLETQMRCDSVETC